ncbi:MAG: hypothetical protein QXU32_09935 [Nitrososphaerales archaeon]
MNSNSEMVRRLNEEIRVTAQHLRELVYAAPTQWVWDSFGSAIAVEQLAETIEKIENHVKEVQKYCDDKYREFTNALIGVMWAGLQTKNHEAILQATRQLISIDLDFAREPFALKPG